ncbi:DEKNAAC102876 [Brettanomyces naardenensis]|uniref:DEKNAAC102876 n=1 Tax=Brettanomyces naardenensis TaxID=13370 RepID=A0A448YLT5_BRENA|nr:DEKNAAC102876 [Brettanomyces naardenensis]
MVTSVALKLAEVPEGYVVQLAAGETSKALLITNSGDIRTTDAEKINLVSPFRVIAGIMGIIQLRANYYLLTVDGASEVGAIYGDKKIYKVATFSILPLSSSKFKVDEDEVKYLDILKAHLDSATLYFAYDYDLTRSFGLQNQGGSQVDHDYMWNYFVSTPLLDAAKNDSFVHQFVLPLIYGYVKFVKTTINASPVTFGLITRRSIHRAGTRYFRRGINKDGYVANFNESEQFLVVHGEKGQLIDTYLQTRGSVPVYWAEMNNLKYKPSLLLGPSDYVPVRQHFDRTITKYGTNYLVNLVNQSGHEKPVKLAYENAVTALADPNIKYTYFDFHHECRNMHWERVALLLEKLKANGLSQTDYSSFSDTGDALSSSRTQRHTVRSNCMDCLDRTNVVQSMLGRWFLQKQLEDIGIVEKDQEWTVIDPAFGFVFRNIWADNADAVSIAYSGTGALKTDYTRTGKRTKVGALNDLWNSITRYIKNNFRDGPRQDGFDLFLGNALPYEIGSSQLQDQRSSFVQAVPYGFFVSVVIFFTTLSSPKGSLTEFKNYSFLTFFFLLAAFSLRYMVNNGLQYVNWPKFCSLDFINRRDVVKKGKFEGIEYTKSGSYSKYVEDTKKE